jgi:hypothetical protein
MATARLASRVAEVAHPGVLAGADHVLDAGVDPVAASM